MLRISIIFLLIATGLCSVEEDLVGNSTIVPVSDETDRETPVSLQDDNETVAVVSPKPIVVAEQNSLRRRRTVSFNPVTLTLQGSQGTKSPLFAVLSNMPLRPVREEGDEEIEAEESPSSSDGSESVNELALVDSRMTKYIPASQRYYGDEDYIPYFDDNGETGRELFDTETPIAGDADIILALEGRNVIMTRYEAAQLALLTLGSFIALYGWTLVSIWLYNYYTSSS